MEEENKFNKKTQNKPPKKHNNIFQEPRKRYRSFIFFFQIISREQHAISPKNNFSTEFMVYDKFVDFISGLQLWNIKCIRP